MCFSSPKTPAAPPPPIRPPAAPTKPDAAKRTAKAKSRQTAAVALGGRTSTILQGALGTSPRNVAAKTLLGA